MNDFAEILTKNARNWFYLRHNSVRGRHIADSKTRTKKILAQAGVPVPQVLALFKTQQEIIDFPWEKLEGNFVIKPVSGYGGEGILVVKKKAKWAGEWFLMDGRKVDIADIRFHCFEILQGRFSLKGIADRVLVEERIKIHPKFLRFTNTGTPDIRVIVFNKIPVMAMLRIPTEESKGKANLHQGAIGLGVDLATGITTYGVHHDQLISRIYDRRRKKMIKVNGIKIPYWKKILETAIKCQEAVPSLGYLGVDMVLDQEKGPMVLELNARPGLSIQICNQAGLRRRLERVSGLKVRSVAHGIKIAQALFGESFVDKVIGFIKKHNIQNQVRIHIVTDHGSIRIPDEAPNDLDPNFFKSSKFPEVSHRYVSVTNIGFTQLPDYLKKDCVLLPSNEFGNEKHYLCAKRANRFKPTENSSYVHGGVSPEEVIVPYMTFEAW